MRGTRTFHTARATACATADIGAFSKCVPRPKQHAAGVQMLDTLHQPETRVIKLCDAMVKVAARQ